MISQNEVIHTKLRYKGIFSNIDELTDLLMSNKRKFSYNIFLSEENSLAQEI